MSDLSQQHQYEGQSGWFANAAGGVSRLNIEGWSEAQRANAVQGIEMLMVELRRLRASIERTPAT